MGGLSTEAMSVAEAAEQLGLSQSGLYLQIRRGAPREPDGQVVPANVQAWRDARKKSNSAARSEAMRRRAAERRAAGEQEAAELGLPTVAPAAPAFADAPSANGALPGSLEAKRAVETERVRLKLLRESGELIELKTCKSICATRMAQFQAALRRQGRRVSAVIASEIGGRALDVQRIIDRENFDLLDSIARVGFVDEEDSPPEAQEAAS